jgi:membrane associated rhomboid family serine protease
MRGRYPSPSGISYSFGPGPLTPAIKILVITNVAAFLLTLVAPTLIQSLGLWPQRVFEQGQLWRAVTYMFLHGGIFHILFNLLALWMFGVELERMWGTKYFTKYYFVTGIGAAVTTLVLGFLPGDLGNQLYYSNTIGASGAVYGILLAYALYFPHRPILMFMLFPLPARVYVAIVGAIALLSSISAGGGVAHTAHLGGMIAGYLFLKGGRLHLLSEIQYRYLKWRINRSRRRFDVYHGGRADDANRRVH